MEINERKQVLELLLWMTNRPLKYSDFKNILGAADCPKEKELIEEIVAIAKELDARGAPMQLKEVADGFQLASRPAFALWVRKLFKDQTTVRLSPPALETLSIVAYKQPATRSEIEEIRGVDVAAVMETLLERKLIKILGRKETLGHPLLYGTTMEFMRQFGLKSLTELPALDDLVPPDDAAPAPMIPQPQEASVEAAAPAQEAAMTAEGAPPADDSAASSTPQS